jgi:hypothetical protein
MVSMLPSGTFGSSHIASSSAVGMKKENVGGGGEGMALSRKNPDYYNNLLL